MASPKTEANGDISHNPATDVAAPSTTPDTPKPQRKRPQRPNYALIHAKPLPLEVYPLPAFIPHSPLSLLRIAAVIIKQFFSPPSSHPETLCIGYFSPETRSVHVTDPVHIRALWEMGFFGKGTLSRSEPSWLEREKARLKAGGGGGTSEEATRKRREERRLFKLERARLEREQIEEQLRQEKALAAAASQEQLANGTPDASSSNSETSSLSHVFPWMHDAVSVDSIENNVPTEAEPLIDTKEKQSETNEPNPIPQQPKKVEFANPLTTESSHPKPTTQEPTVPTNQEHLQLTLEEAFFLSYALNALKIISPTTPHLPLTTSTLFTLNRTHSTFPPTTQPHHLKPDDPFLLNYAVYHYYRSLGWVVRPGVKFSVDYLLYNRGPVFSHAEFAILIIPEYAPGSPEEGKAKDWWWLHCINRVQSQVKKSLVLCYVRVPRVLPSVGEEGEVDVGAVLRGYEVREFVVRRWVANRSRD